MRKNEIARDLFGTRRHYVAVPVTSKLFRAIVVMGVAMTASCDDDRCHHCSPPPSDGNMTDTKLADAGVGDAPRDAPGDAPVDTVAIL